PPATARRTTLDAQPGPGTGLGPGRPTGSGPPAGWALRYDSGPHDFIGRRDEIDLILASPPVPLLHVVGPPGAGKSALLAEVRRRAPGRVALGSVVGTGALRLSWLHDLVTQLGIGGPPAHAVQRAMAAGRSLFREELAELADVLRERGPLVLAIDDAARLDEQSAAELAWLTRCGGELCLALALRPEAQLAELPVARLHGAAVLHLRRLTHAEFRGTRDPDAAESSGGIPALLAALHQPRRVAVATAVHLVGLRTRGLPEAAGRILRTCAALGSLRVDQIATLTDLPLPEVLRCTDQLVLAELVDEGPGGHIRHSSELVRAALAEQVSSAHTMYLRQRLKAVVSA
ncbi:MAG TPA: ATP-binding protein, partial [Catenuloplanes sp.]